MKRIAFVFVLVLVAVGSVTPRLAAANQSGPSASGTYRFVMADGASKSVEFNATSDERSVATGVMTFRDEARVVEQDVDGTGERPDEAGEFYMTADINTLTIENNRALMGGIVRDSSHSAYVGRWVQLVVEDNPDGREPDKVSWCFCKPEASGWTPVDAEDPRDEGAWWHWWATDDERRDDTGVPSANIIPGSRTGCPTFALSTYEFAELGSAEGDIQVQP
jgi:hypothetical protein